MVQKSMITGLRDAAREAGVIWQMDADKILALFARDYK